MKNNKNNKYTVDMKPLLGLENLKHQETYFSSKRHHENNKSFNKFVDSAISMPSLTLNTCRSQKGLQEFDLNEIVLPNREKKMSDHKIGGRFSSMDQNIERVNFSSYTTMNNNIFNNHIQTINRHERKKLNIYDRKNFDFSNLSEKFSFFKKKMEKELNFKNMLLGGFITQRSLPEDDTPLDLAKHNGKWLLLDKLNFCYCFLRIKNKEAPIKVGNLENKIIRNY